MAIKINVLPHDSLARLSYELVPMPDLAPNPGDFFTAVVPKASDVHPRWRVSRFVAHSRITGGSIPEDDFVWASPDGRDPTAEEAADALLANFMLNSAWAYRYGAEVIELTLILKHVDGVGLMRTADGLSLMSSGDKLVRAD